MAKPEWGAKRHCAACGARFYDLNRDPIACPECGEVFTPEVIVRGKRVRVASRADAVKAVAVDLDLEDDVEDVEDGDDDDAVVLDEDDDDDAVVAAPEPDEAEEDVVEADDDVLLEEDDEDADDDLDDLVEKDEDDPLSR